VVVVRNVPALVCEQCGADWIEDEIAEHLEKTVNEVRRSRRQMNPLAKKVLKTPAALPSLIGKIEELKK
jgi:hypothetical protein